MTGLLLLALLFVSDFSDTVSCTVQGYVWRSQDTDPVSFSRADSCVGVRVETAGPTMVLYSPTYWVMVIVPAEHGQRRFQYRWQANLAHIGADTVPVQWGYVEKG